MKKNGLHLYLLIVLSIIFSIALSIALSSCNDETAINKMLGTSASAPVFTGYKVVSGTQIDFAFDMPVKVIYANFEPLTEVAVIEDGQPVSINFVNDVSGGKKITADILVEDQAGNSLNVLIPFRTRNDRVPKFVINEIRLTGTKPRSEFIELKTKTAGNLGALRVFAASTSIEDPIYEFPPIEVTAGEYVVLHLRTYPEQQYCIDELDNDKTLAKITGTTAKETQDTARDLFVPTNTKLLHNSDVIYILDQDDAVREAVMFSEEEKSWNKNSALTNAAEKIARDGAWLDVNGISVKTPAFADAAKSTANTTTRTLCRDEDSDDSNTSAEWYICGSSKGSPGLKNSNEKYE